MRLRNPLRAHILLGFCAAFVGLCDVGCSPQGGASSGATATGAASVASTSQAAKEDEEIKPKEKEEEVRPLYPIDDSPMDPSAQRFCETVHDLPESRRGECCGSKGSKGRFTGECTRVLSAAIRLKTVTLDSAAIDKCVEAFTKELEGCGWVGPSAPMLPEACESVITGLLGEKAVCRSSLECADDKACQGLTTTRVGKCLPPKASGLICGGTVDTLAALTRQNRAAERHKECEGYCARPLCTDALAMGAACKTDGQCGADRACIGGKCRGAALPGPGKACAEGRCARGARCVSKSCILPKGEGEACESDLECQGACEKPGGATPGKCRMRCTVAKIPTKPAFVPKSASTAQPSR